MKRNSGSEQARLIFQIVFMVGSFLFTSILLAQESQKNNLFMVANEYYRQENFDEALKTYQKIPQKSAHVYFNMGNCAFKQGKKGYALLYWRRAEKGLPVLEKCDVADNIEFLQEKINANVQGSAVPSSQSFVFIKKISHRFMSFVRSVPVAFLQIIVIFFWFFLFMYLRYLYIRRFKFLISILFFGLSFFGVVLMLRYNYDLKKYGVIVAPTATVFSGPQETFPTLTTLVEGQEVTIHKNVEGFFKVKVGALTGWIRAQEMERV